MIPRPEAARTHTFVAVAFVDDLPLDWVTPLLPNPRVTPHELHAVFPDGGEVFAFLFGAVVFQDVGPDRRDALLRALRTQHPRLVPDVVREEFNVREEAGARVGMTQGCLVVDRLGSTRAAVVALIVAQSAAMETYERIVEKLFARTRELLDQHRIDGEDAS